MHYSEATYKKTLRLENQIDNEDSRGKLLLEMVDQVISTNYPTEKNQKQIHKNHFFEGTRQGQTEAQEGEAQESEV